LKKRGPSGPVVGNNNEAVETLPKGIAGLMATSGVSDQRIRNG